MSTKSCGLESHQYKHLKAFYEPKYPLDRRKTQFSFDWRAVLQTTSEAGLNFRHISSESVFSGRSAARRTGQSNAVSSRARREVRKTRMPTVGLELSLSSHLRTPHFPPYAFADCGNRIQAYSHTSISICEAKSRAIFETYSSVGHDLAREKSSSPPL